MIKVKVNNEYKDVVKIFCGGTLQKEIIKVWSREAQEYVYESSVEYTGSLPITINANGNALIDYRIYGADSGVGEPTENLFDKDNGFENYALNINDGTTIYFTGADYVLSDYISIASDTVTMSANVIKISGSGAHWAIYDENKTFIRGGIAFKAGAFVKRTAVIDTSEAAFIRVDYALEALSNCMLNLGSTAPTSYIPYGYKLPMIVNNGITNIVPPAPAETKTSNGITVTSDGKGTYTISGTATADAVGLAFIFDHAISCGRKNTVAIFNGFTSSTATMHFKGQAGVFGLGTLNRAFYNLQFLANKTLTGIVLNIPSGATVNGTISPLIFDGVNVAPTEFVPYVPSVSYDVPIYIGENQLDSVEGVSDYVDRSSGKIVRMIGEYTFTGDESFNKYGNSDVFYTSTTIDPVGITTVNTITMRCDHPAFTAIENKDTRYWLNPEADDICCFLPGGRSQVFLRSTSNFTTATECKAYLKAQYDNGTPVKISYWLKTPIEEAPPVSFPEIPTIDGTTVIDYDGDPKPSQMYIKYRR